MTSSGSWVKGLELGTVHLQDWIRDDMCHKYSSSISQEALSFYFWLPCCPLLSASLLITQDLALELKESKPPHQRL